MTSSISGLGSGLDTNAIIEQLVAIERGNQNLVKARGTAAQLKLASWSAIRTQLTALKTASQSLARPTGWLALTASSSNQSAVGVTAGSGSYGGIISFTVDRLAAAGSMRSVNTLSGTDAIVSADSAIFVASGGAALGFSAFASNDALAAGEYTIEVTQSSEAATKTGGTALSSETIITGANNTITLEINGDSTVLTIADGTYTRAQLVAAIQDAADSVGASVTVSLTADNELEIATTREGSAATIQVTGGSALGDLGLSVDGSAITGVDGKVRVDEFTEATVTNIDGGGSVVLDAGGGATITATISGGLREGEITGKNVSVGDGTLSTVVSRINAANVGVTASAVHVGNGLYRLQITARNTGANNGPNIDATEFGAAVGGFVTLTEAADALLTVGEGDGAYQVTSDSNTVSGLLPGSTITLKSTTTDPVTVTVERDAAAIADSVQSLVDAANALREAINLATKYDPDTRKASPLTGDSTVRRLASAINRALVDAVPWANPTTPGLAGVSVKGSGEITFDRSVFLTAFAADPDGMEDAFTQFATATSDDVTFLSAGDRARAGTYDIVVTQPATQASSVGLDGSWPLGVTQTVKVRVGSTVAEYEIQATDTQQDAVDGINAALQGAGLDLVATISGSGIEIRTNNYGANARFSVAWDGATYEDYAGIDVAGTIGGITANGSGQTLTVPFDDATLGGLSVTVTATTAGSLGTITYSQGIGQRVSSAILEATDVITGYITSTENTLKSRIKFIETQVESMERRVALFEARLRKQYAALESTLGVLQQQSNWLAGQVAGLFNSQ